MVNESLTATLQIGPSRHLPAHPQKGLCKALACIPSVAAAKSARSSHTMGQETSNFPQRDPRINHGLLPATFADGKPFAVALNFSRNCVLMEKSHLRSSTLTRLCSSTTTKSGHETVLFESTSCVESGTSQSTPSSASGSFG
jgi:hypothetical protein